MQTVLITGSNRGIGLEFCKQYAADGWQVISVQPFSQTLGYSQRTGGRLSRSG